MTTNKGILHQPPTIFAGYVVSSGICIVFGSCCARTLALLHKDIALAIAMVWGVELLPHDLGPHTSRPENRCASQGAPVFLVRGPGRYIWNWCARSAGDATFRKLAAECEKLAF